MQIHSLWDSAPGQQLEGHQWHTRRSWSDWHLGTCWENASYWAKLQKPGSSIVPSLSPPPTQSQKQWSRLPHPGDYLRLHPIQLTGVLFYNRPCYYDSKSKQLYLMHRNKHREAAKLRRQRNMAQMKEQNKTLEKELNKMEISNLSDVDSKHWILGCSIISVRISMERKKT